MFCLFKEGPHKQKMPIEAQYSKCGSRRHTTIALRALFPIKLQTPLQTKHVFTLSPLALRQVSTGQ